MELPTLEKHPGKVLEPRPLCRVPGICRGDPAAIPALVPWEDRFWNGAANSCSSLAGRRWNLGISAWILLESRVGDDIFPSGMDVPGSGRADPSPCPSGPGTPHGTGREVTGSFPVGFGSAGLFRDGVSGDFEDTGNVFLTSEAGKAGKAGLSLHPFRASVSLGSRWPWNTTGGRESHPGFGNVQREREIQGSPRNTGAKRRRRSCRRGFP